MQNTAYLLMIRPIQFAYNSETAVNNSFQVENNDNAIQEKALQEFDSFVEKLEANGINVTVVQDTKDPYTPDSIFPNNWISFHSNNTICIYPMYAKNRRQERKQHVIETIKNKFKIARTIDFTGFEASNIFLEGTGSMVLDRTNKLAYACLSQRTNQQILEDFCTKLEYTSISFIANDAGLKPIYHTNVMMCVADKYVVICLESISDLKERNYVIETFKNTGKEIIDITYNQMNQFAGNMLQVKNNEGKQFLVMSTQAFESLTLQQVQTIEQYNSILHSSIKTIETNGGGSARCMMAEVFLEPLTIN